MKDDLTLDLFDAAASQEAKIAGMAQAADNKKSLLKYARKLAVEIAKEKGYVYSDLVIERMVANGTSERALGNAGGSVFTNGLFVWTGERHVSTRKIGHGNEQKIWVLK
jgi:hypothetical protein